MVLSIQLQVLVVSFVYGIVLAYILRMQYKYFFESKFWYRIFLTIVFVFDNVVLYFLVLRLINNGIFHIYFLFLIIIGFIFGLKLLDKKI